MPGAWVKPGHRPKITPPRWKRPTAPALRPISASPYARNAYPVMLRPRVMCTCEPGAGVRKRAAAHPRRESATRMTRGRGDGRLPVRARPLMRAQLWEVTAIPELRVAASALARELLSRGSLAVPDADILMAHSRRVSQRWPAGRFRSPPPLTNMNRVLLVARFGPDRAIGRLAKSQQVHPT